MASLQLTAFPDAVHVALGDVALEEVVTVSGVSAQSSALPGSKKIYNVRLYSDVDCFVTWGDNPTALNTGAGGRMLGANNPEYFAINAGKKIAVIERV